MSEPATGTVTTRDQVRLSFARTAEICLNGIYYRLFRSLVTVSIVSVAIAFMMYMLAGSVIGNSVNQHARERALGYKAYDRWLSWAEEPFSRRTWVRILAGCGEGDYRAAAARQWGGMSPTELDAFLVAARGGDRYLTFFEALSPGKRMMLTEGMQDAFLLDWLLDESSREAFIGRLADMSAAPLPGTTADLRDYLETYRARLPAWRALERGRASAVDSLAARYPGERLGDLFAAPPPDFKAALQELGFADASVDLGPAAREGVFTRQISRLAGLLRSTPFRRDIAQRAGVSHVEVDLDVLRNVCSSRRGIAHFRESVERQELALEMDDETVQAVLERNRQRSRILEIEASTKGFAEGWLGFSIHTLWLIGVSFVVCIVGIANAMLMSVMERFREIATMKCLGATDGFVMVLFVLESCIQGIVGGIAGALLGLLLSLPDAMFKYGRLAWSVFPLEDVLVTALVAIGTGVVLAAVASMYPAYVAAKLVPMEAMRVE